MLPQTLTIDDILETLKQTSIGGGGERRPPGR